MEKRGEVDGGMVATLVFLAFFIFLMIFFLVMRYYRELTSKMKYWDDPEHDPWRPDQGQVFPNYHKLDWEPLLNDNALEKMSGGTCGRKSRVTSRACSRAGSRAVSRAGSRVASRMGSRVGSRVGSRMGSRAGSIVGIEREGGFRNMSGLPRDPDQFVFEMPPSFVDFLNQGVKDFDESSEKDSEEGTPHLKNKLKAPTSLSDTYAPQELSKLVFTTEDKKVYRKTPAGSRTGSQERYCPKAVPDQAPAKDEIVTVANSKTLHTEGVENNVKSSNKSKGILVTKNERNSENFKQEKLRRVSNTSAAASPKAVCLDKVKNTIPVDESEKIDPPAPTAAAPVKKTYKKIKKVKTDNTSAKESDIDKSANAAVTFEIKKKEINPSSETPLQPNTLEPASPTVPLVPPKKTYKKIRKTVLVKESTQAAVASTSPSLPVSSPTSPSAAISSTPIPPSASHPVPPVKKTYKKIKKKSETCQNDSDVIVTPLNTCSLPALDSPA